MLRLIIKTKLAIDRLICADAGQGLTEYALVLAIIAVAAMATLALVGGPTQNAFSTAGSGLTRT